MLTVMSEHDIGAGYARLYGPLAVVSVVIAFLPILDEEEYGTLWEMASRPGGSPAVFGIILMFGLVGCLGYSALRPARGTGPPIAIIVLAAVITVMLLTKPGTSSPGNSLTPEGDAALAIAIGTVLLAVSHVLHLRKAR